MHSALAQRENGKRRKFGWIKTLLEYYDTKHDLAIINKIMIILIQFRVLY